MCIAKATFLLYRLQQIIAIIFKKLPKQKHSIQTGDSHPMPFIHNILMYLGNYFFMYIERSIMDRYAMNRCARQPYGQMPAQPKPKCEPAPCKEKHESMFDGLDTLPLAMGYVPCQKFRTTFELCKGFQVGTVFPELCKPFCGQRRCCR